MNIFDKIWNYWGLLCGIILFVGIFYRIPILFDMSVGGGSAWIIWNVIENQFDKNRNI